LAKLSAVDLETVSRILGVGMSAGRYFVFEYQGAAAGRRYSWRFMDDVLSERMFGRWHDTAQGAVDEARAFRKAIADADIPRQPSFQKTDSESRPS
jgi:hypothetical protein